MIKVLFHSYGNGRHCFDGFAAAYAAWVVFRDSAEYIPCVYDAPAPGVNRDDTVFLLDFSYPLDVLETWALLADIVVLDHHKTAQETLEGLEYAHFDMNRSGAQMAWDFFQERYFATANRSHTRPDLIEYVADRDLWRKELYSTEEVARALANFPFDFEVWHTLVNLPNYVDFMSRIGEPLQKAHEAAVEQVIADATLREFAGHRVWSTNTDRLELVSDALNALCKKHPETPFAFNYHAVEEGVKFELRSIGDFDVSAVAQQYGGGGHKNAAGCLRKLVRFGESKGKLSGVTP